MSAKTREEFKNLTKQAICEVKEDVNMDSSSKGWFIAGVVFIVIVLAFCIVSTSLAIQIANGNVANTNSSSTLDAFKGINIAALVLAILAFIPAIVVPIVIQTADC